MIVKVCGMRDAGNIRAVEAAGADMIGLVFYKESPRCVGMINSRSGLIPDFPDRKVASVSDTGKTGTEHKPLVGVFVDDMAQNIITRAYNYKLDYVQLHGSEDVTLIDNLRHTIDPDIRPGLKIIKSISISSEDDFARCKEYEGHVDMFLFDTACSGYGGCGQHFDWTMLGSYSGSTPFLLSGGIGPDDADRIRTITHPMFAGVDINSRFETEPGVKDVAAVAEFIAKVKK